jgi:hypothetical protein
MTKEQLRMQMLAGIITEGQYKAMLSEEDVMGKVGKSYADSAVSPDEKVDGPILAANDLPQLFSSELGSKFRVISTDKKVNPDNITYTIKLLGGLQHREITIVYKFFGKDTNNKFSQKSEEIILKINDGGEDILGFRRSVKGKYNTGLLNDAEGFTSVMRFVLQSDLRELSDRIS